MFTFLQMQRNVVHQGRICVRQNALQIVGYIARVKAIGTTFTLSADSCWRQRCFFALTRLTRDYNTVRLTNGGEVNSKQIWTAISGHRPIDGAGQ